MKSWLSTDAPAATILIRILVGWVFLSEGIQKFLYPDALGVGRFAKIGIPAPHVMGPFVATVEIVFGALLLLGLATRPAAVVLLIDIGVAILSTKIPILLGRGFGPFAVPKLPTYGFWSMLHEARTDFSMALGLLFLLAVGAGPRSLDGGLAGPSVPPPSRFWRLPRLRDLFLVPRIAGRVGVIGVIGVRSTFYTLSTALAEDDSRTP